MRGENKGSGQNESKAQRFNRVAEKRVENVLKSLRGLSQCSNKRMYEWNDEQLTKIWDAINLELQSCKDSYTETQPEEFKL